MNDLNEALSEFPFNTQSVNRPSGFALAAHPEPFAHQKTVRKIHQWTSAVIKPIVIAGDSNLARIPTFNNSKVQVDSFPGANFYHLTGVLEKLPPNPDTEKVIVSAGLNNCLAKQLPTRTWKQLLLLLGVVRSRFPNADVHVPVINFSFLLDKQQATQAFIICTFYKIN